MNAIWNRRLYCNDVCVALQNIITADVYKVCVSDPGVLRRNVYNCVLRNN